VKRALTVLTAAGISALALAGCGSAGGSTGPTAGHRACVALKAELARADPDPAALTRAAALTPDEDLRAAVSTFSSGRTLVAGGALTIAGEIDVISGSRAIDTLCAAEGVPHASGRWTAGDIG
jgi:hypothetical protein